MISDRKRQLVEGLKRLRERKRRGDIIIPWRVVLYGRRLVDLEPGTPPPFFNVYHDGATGQRAAVEKFLEQSVPLFTGEQFWSVLLSQTPLDGNSRDVRSALGFTARDALELFVALAVSGRPFTSEQERDLLGRMEEVLRGIFPASRDVLTEDLTDPTRVPREIFAELDCCLYDHGLVSGYLLGTTLHFARYSHADLLAALCEVAGL